MITLRNKLYESLLDDEDDLVNDNGGFADEINNFIKYSKSLAKNMEMFDCYIDNQLSKGGGVKLCPCRINKPSLNVDKTNYIDEIPSDCIKKEIGFGKVFDGTVNIWGYVEGWPPLLSIAPVFSTTVYSDELINQESIPEYSVMFSTQKLSAVSGLNINCRMFTATYDKTPTDMITINISGNPKKINTVSFRGDKLKSWTQLKNIQSNVDNLTLYGTAIAKDIIKQYKVNLTKENNTCAYTINQPFKQLLKNFKNLKEITLDIKYSLYKDRDGWSVFYNFV